MNKTNNIVAVNTTMDMAKVDNAVHVYVMMAARIVVPRSTATTATRTKDSDCSISTH